MRIYLDMDNTLADFSLTLPEPIALEKMYEVGYFRNLRPITGGHALSVALQALGHEVYILSACIRNSHCQEEKRQWLQVHFPNISAQNWVFTPVGEPKANYVNAAGALLVDDYGRNIREWQAAGGEAIKFKAGESSEREYARVLETVKENWGV